MADTFSEKDLEELDRIVIALNMKLATVLKDKSDWQINIPRLLSGLMVVIAANRPDVMQRILTAVEPLLAGLAEEKISELMEKHRESVKSDLDKRRN